MTVCIAAICRHNGRPFVVGAADRMLTSGDIEFNASLPKIHKICNSVAVFTAGDYDPHTFALDKTAAYFAKSESQDLEDVAHYYAHRLNEFRRRHAEAHAFGDIGMTVDSFVNSQSNMSQSMVYDLYHSFQRHWIFCEAMVCGVDSKGAHIFAVDHKGSVAPKRDVGFDAIGTGARLAMSQFMFSKHSEFNVLVDTLFLLYRSKKFAESAPGVGEDSDLVHISQDGMLFFASSTRDALDASYGEYREGVMIAENNALNKNWEYLQSLWSPPSDSEVTESESS